MRLQDLSMATNIELLQIDIVAFDVFDTIISRKCSPEYINLEWADKLINRFGLHFTGKQFLALRLKAARIIKFKNLFRGKYKEYSYSEMIRTLLKIIHYKGDIEQFLEYSLCAELDLEIKYTFVNENVRELIFDARRLGKRVICISDFYLPADIVKRLMSYHGIKLDEYYISTDYLAQKISGKLYAMVLKKEKASADKVLMIGDTIISDVINAKKKGMNAWLLENYKQHQEYKRFNDALKKSECKLERFLKSDPIKRRTIPFANVSFLMFIFVDRLFKKMKQDNQKNVFFMSREGQFFKLLFDCYQSVNVKKGDQIQTHYFCVSRKATLIPTIKTIDKNSFNEIYKNYKNLTLKIFLRNLGLDTNDRILSEFKDLIAANTCINNFPESWEYEALLRSIVFREECMKVAEQQRSMFLEYINSFGVPIEKEGLCLVDVGYSGTAQDNIRKILSERTKITGYYMISYADRTTVSDNNRKFGVIFDVNNDFMRKDEFTYNSGVIEMIALASHGSVEGYEKINGIVTPIFTDNQDEIKCYNEIITVIQQDIIDAFTQILKLMKDSYMVESNYYENFKREYKRFIFNPTVTEMEMYLSIPFFDNFAIYREYHPCKELQKKKVFSFEGLFILLKSKGHILREQNTHWMAAAMYKINMRLLNSLTYLFSFQTMKLYDLMLERIRKNRKVVV